MRAWRDVRLPYMFNPLPFTFLPQAFLHAFESPRLNAILPLCAIAVQGCIRCGS